MGVLKKSRIQVVELAPCGFRYYRGWFRNFDEVPPWYTWRKVDYRMDETVVYVDMSDSDANYGRCFSL